MMGMPTATTGDAQVKELRVALVLYGGVSLAIYMHGATREIHRLVRGSMLGEEDAATLTPSERIYRDLLAEKASHEGRWTRVIVDTIAGSSAGGINGVYLAKAMAGNRSQEALRDLWFERADLNAIFRGPKWLPWKARVPWVAATLWKPALEGDHMAAWLFEALDAMDQAAAGGGEALLPPGHELELFVTLTDFHGYARQLSLDDPPVVSERRHRHVMAFRYGRGHDDFSADPVHNAALAFAARGTSSLPGGFPPVDFATFERALQQHAGVTVDLAGLDHGRLFRQYALSGADVHRAAFVDGGVLDNKPFGHAIEAVQHKRTTVEVDRCLVYLDPDPVEVQQRADQPKPSALSAAFEALTRVRGAEPVLDDILALQSRNERVRQVRAVIETNWNHVAAAVNETLGGDQVADPPADGEAGPSTDWNDRLHQRAVWETGLGYTVYVRAKISDAVDHWARTINRLMRFPRDSTHAAFVRASLHTWATRAGLFEQESAQPSPAQVDFLRDVDLGYRERRLRFVLGGLHWWYTTPPVSDHPPERAQLEEASRTLSDAIDELFAAMRGDGLPAELLEQLAGCFHEDQLERFVYRGDQGVTEFAEQRASSLSELAEAFRAHLAHRFDGFGRRIDRGLRQQAVGWDRETRRQLMLRYVGFPLWDALLFPYESIVDVGEQDHIEIVRLSPRDPELLPARAGRAKLVGAGLGHLGAFLSRAGREQDYLWGRLDSAERMVTLLLGREHEDHDAWCHRAFEAILSEEGDALPHANELLDHVAAHVASSKQS